jgi:hypothetical protein
MLKIQNRKVIPPYFKEELEEFLILKHNHLKDRSDEMTLLYMQMAYENVYSSMKTFLSQRIITEEEFYTLKEEFYKV